MFNVYAFGAVGDGKANDTAAIQAAIEASIASSSTTGAARGVVWTRECVAVAHLAAIILSTTAPLCLCLMPAMY